MYLNVNNRQCYKDNSFLYQTHQQSVPQGNNRQCCTVQTTSFSINFLTIVHVRQYVIGVRRVTIQRVQSIAEILALV